MTGRNR